MITGAWLDVRILESELNLDSDGDGVNDDEDSCPDSAGEDGTGCPDEANGDETDSNNGVDMSIGIALMLCIILVWGNFAWLIFADNRGEG